MEVVDAITQCLKETCFEASPIGALRLGGNPGFWDWLVLIPEDDPEAPKKGLRLAYQRGLVERGPDGRTRVRNGAPIRLFRCNHWWWWGTELAVRTGPPEFVKALKMCAANLGLEIAEEPTRVVLRASDNGEILQTRFETEFFRWLCAPYMPPQDRVHGALIWPEIEGLTPMIETEWDQWVAKSRWIDTDYVEPHQYTTRVMATDDKTFARAVVTILTFGQDQLKYGKLFRVLKRGRWIFWTMGYRVDETAVINRKEHGKPDEPSLFGSDWVVNKAPLVLKSVRGKAKEVIWQA
jgi:hypothetical protein